MLDPSSKVQVFHHAAFGPGEFPARWYGGAYELHCQAWPTPWEGRLGLDRFIAELEADHTNILFETNESGDGGTLLAYLKWKATERFHFSRDDLSDPSLASLPASPPAGYVCAYEITASPNRAWQGLGRRLLGEALKRWERHYADGIFCTYSPKRDLTTVLRRLAVTRQHGRPALEAFAHRAAAAASRHVDEWIPRLGQSLERFIRSEIVAVDDRRIMQHLNELGDRYGREVIDGVVAAIGIAYNFVLRASSGLPACGPAAFHRALGAEHWRQYPASATNCADALGLVDHWRYSHDAARREKCARQFKEQRTTRAQPAASPDQLIVLA